MSLPDIQRRCEQRADGVDGALRVTRDRYGSYWVSMVSYRLESGPAREVTVHLSAEQYEAQDGLVTKMIDVIPEKRRSQTFAGVHPGWLVPCRNETVGPDRVPMPVVASIHDDRTPHQFRTWLRGVMHSRSLSARKVSTMCEVSVNTIRNWIYYDRLPTLPALVRVAKAFGGPDAARLLVALRDMVEADRRARRGTEVHQ